MPCRIFLRVQIIRRALRSDLDSDFRARYWGRFGGNDSMLQCRSAQLEPRVMSRKAQHGPNIGRPPSGPKMPYICRQHPIPGVSSIKLGVSHEWRTTFEYYSVGWYGSVGWYFQTCLRNKPADRGSNGLFRPGRKRNLLKTRVAFKHPSSPSLPDKTAAPVS